MQQKLIAGLALAGSLLAFVACSQEPQPGTVQDEAMKAGRTAASFPGADEDYFRDMDYGYRRASDPSVVLDVNEVRGRNNWNAWTFGNDQVLGPYGQQHLWGIRSPESPLVPSADRVLHRGFDPLPRQQVSRSRVVQIRAAADFDAPTPADAEACKKEGKTWVPIGRDVRWRYFGLVNEPCFEKAKGPDEYGLWLDKRVPVSAECPADPFENETKYPGVKIDARGTTVPVGSYYGKASGILGLRLFPNPAFDDAAKKKWDEAKRNGDAARYYTDPDFFNDKNF